MYNTAPCIEKYTELFCKPQINILEIRTDQVYNKVSSSEPKRSCRIFKGRSKAKASGTAGG